ncbi:biotin/lipoyl-binding protein [Massilia antarctica]|uniref:Biotin/lipoyl-binding protein n=1 Tax=Massilia antarctica TaxID=2765360 RepID=A0AA49A9Q6_9BURK|nr:biotin/lipoyl-binding protein [Massilia antarctica]QPI51032.1 biotin/lipoyl-binding protein [Massilia antarctica]
MGLFRAEVIENARVRQYGSVLLNRPVSYAALTLFFSTIIVLLVLFFVFSSYTRKVQLAGVLLPTSGLVRVVSSQGGILAEQLVSEGQLVKAGQQLFILTNDRSMESSGGAGKLISSLLQARRESLILERAQVTKQFTQSHIVIHIFFMSKINDLQ